LDRTASGQLELSGDRPGLAPLVVDGLNKGIIMAIEASSQRDSTTISQINVTPLVDVMLVLLVIFMVTAPIIQQGVQVNLPQDRSNAIPGSEEHLVVTVAKNGRIYLNDNAMSLPELGEKLRAIRKLDANKQIYLRADQDVRYGTVMQTIAEIKQAGIERLGMVTRPPSEKGN
jgi:biopolymer transport protein TolR